MKKVYILGLVLIGVASCKPKIEPQKPSNGNVDLTRYLAVGNSLTAGYMDGSLYREGQMNSFPLMLSEQFATAQHTHGFLQPLLPGEHGYPNPKFVLRNEKGYCDDFYALRTVPFPGALDSAGTGSSVAYLGPYNNVGVPNIRCVDFLTHGYGYVNPYARRFFRYPATDRPLDEAVKLGHTFFTLWIGANDVLGYATGGGEGSPAPISNLDTFRICYDSVISRLAGNGSKGVAMNIPDITSLPFFKTIPANGLVLTKNGADTLNDIYNNTGMRFTEGGSYFVIQDTSVPLKMRQIKDGEYVLLSLPQDSVKCAGWGSRKPIPSRYILTKDEVAKVQSATGMFNNVIAQQAAENDVVLVDMYSYLKTVEAGIKYGGVGYNTKYISGGAFSLDGVHLTPRGYALVANRIISVMNEQFGSSIPMVDVNKYRGINLP